MTVHDRIQIYCAMCRPGMEKQVSSQVAGRLPGVEIIIPLRVLQEKKQGSWQLVERLLLPGYLFFYTEGSLPSTLIQQSKHLYKWLNYGSGLRSLHGDDREYALWLYRHGGRIMPSAVLVTGGEVKAVSGPLADAAGRIIRLDKHKRRAWVAFSFAGEERVVSLSTEAVISQ